MNKRLWHKDTGKWFALVMQVGADKLGYESGEMCDILTMKSEPLLIDLSYELTEHKKAPKGVNKCMTMQSRRQSG